VYKISESKDVSFGINTLGISAIEIAIIEEPYGKESEKVASIGIFLNADANEPDWKVHLPKTDIEGVIISLKKAMELLWKKAGG